MPTSDTRTRPGATRSSAGPHLQLTVQETTGASGLPVRSTLGRWLRRALQRDADITVRIVGTAEGRRLNREFRGRDYATNVLTFVYGADEQTAGLSRPGGRAVLAGDIVLCLPVARREAREKGISMRAHLAHLSVHGALHLQGYDHESAKDAKIMEALESKLLQSLGYADPYATGR